MRITITDDRRKRRSKGRKKNWFPAWKQKKVAEGTWKDKKGDKK